MIPDHSKFLAWCYLDMSAAVNSNFKLKWGKSVIAGLGENFCPLSWAEADPGKYPCYFPIAGEGAFQDTLSLRTQLFKTCSFVLGFQFQCLILLRLKALFPETTKLLKPKLLSEVNQQILPA